MSSLEVAAVVLAAGASTRLNGTAKALLPFGGRTMVEAVLARAKSAGLGPLIAVVSDDATVLRRTLQTSDVAPDRLVVNGRAADGIGGSVSAGVEAAMELDVAAAAILLADEPDVGVESIRATVEGWSRLPSSVARAVYSDRPGHPVLLPRSVFRRVSGLPPSARVLPELRRSGIDVRAVSISGPAPIDVDTARDYVRALRRSRLARPAPDETTPAAAGLRGSPHR